MVSEPVGVEQHQKKPGNSVSLPTGCKIILVLKIAITIGSVSIIFETIRIYIKHNY